MRDLPTGESLFLVLFLLLAALAVLTAACGNKSDNQSENNKKQEKTNDVAGRKNFGPNHALVTTPQPCVMIATWDENKTPDVMMAAWAGQLDYKHIVISLSEHKTTDNLALTKAFTVSFWAKVDIENARTGNSRAVDQGINGSDFGFTMLVNKSVAEDGTVSVFSISKVGGSDWWSSASNVAGDPAQWHQYTMVYDPEESLVVTFIDGERIKEVFADEDEAIKSDFTFCVGGNWAQWDWFNGGNREVTAEGFTGAIDEVKIFAGAVYDFTIING